LTNNKRKKKNENHFHMHRFVTFVFFVKKFMSNSKTFFRT